jgi:hypothetical protein
MRKLAPIALPLALLPLCSPTIARDQNEFAELFAITCMANFYSQDKLRDTLSSALTPEIPPDRAAFFLNHAPGTAWEMHYGKGQYVVALTTDNFCAVYARHAPVAAVRESFVGLVSTAPDPLAATQLDSSSAGPNSDDLATTAFGWSRPEDDVQLVFTLTTSEAAQDPEIQAMASMAYGKKPNNSFKGKPLRGSP